MSSSRIPRLARPAKAYRPPFRAAAASDVAIEVQDASGRIAAVTFPNELVVADGRSAQLGEAIADAINNLFPAGAGMPPAAADAQNGGRGDGAAGGSSPAVHGRANYEP